MRRQDRGDAIAQAREFLLRRRIADPPRAQIDEPDDRLEVVGDAVVQLAEQRLALAQLDGALEMGRGVRRVALLLLDGAAEETGKAAEEFFIRAVETLPSLAVDLEDAPDLLIDHDGHIDERDDAVLAQQV